MDDDRRSGVEDRHEVGRRGIRTQRAELVRLVTSPEWTVDMAVWAPWDWRHTDAIADVVIELRNRLAGLAVHRAELKFERR